MQIINICNSIKDPSWDRDCWYDLSMMHQKTKTQSCLIRKWNSNILLLIEKIHGYQEETKLSKCYFRILNMQIENFLNNLK